MRRNKVDEKEYQSLAERFGIPSSSVKAIVSSFFFAIVKDARRLPFDDIRRIYSHDKFDELVKVVNIPRIGRIGPSYTMYLKWRRNEAKLAEQRSRDEYKIRLSPEEVEDVAGKILKGEDFEIKKRKPTDMYDRVWIVSEKGKKMARQVIPKKK